MLCDVNITLYLKRLKTLIKNDITKAWYKCECIKSILFLFKNFLKDKYLSNNNYLSGNSPASYSGKLPSDKVYNWPNPVYDGQTFIRYYINGIASSVSVKILDLSGELVTTLPATAFSNADNEVVWNVSGVQSGIYYGIVEGNIDGSSETQVIKIAIVK